MRVGIVGAGAIGGAIAAMLVTRGHEVEVTARGEHLAAIEKLGLRLDGAWGVHTAYVSASPLLTRAPELAIVATKAQDAAAAISDNEALLRGIPLLVIQNGLDGITNAHRCAPRADIAGGLATFASSLVHPGHITVTAPGRTYLGVAAGHNDMSARFAASILDPALPTTVVANFAGAQWTKLIINQVNALSAITGLSVQQVIGTPDLRRLMTASMREAVRTGFATGVHYERLQGLDQTLLRLFAAAPLWLGQALPRAMAARMGATPNPGSTLQSVRRGQPSEIDYLNGAVVRAASAVGSTAPINATIVALVHEVESSGEFIAPTDVLARF